jgi:hypothetical protein
MTVYKEEFKNLGGYLVDMSRVTYNSHINCSFFQFLVAIVNLKSFPISMYKSFLKIKEKDV